MNWQPGKIRMVGLSRVLPVRKKARGQRAGLGNKGPSLHDPEVSLWVFQTLEPTREEERKMIAAVLEISISASFDLHVYTFGGVIYRQVKGGPIGYRLTMAVSRVVMAVWGRRLQELLKDAGLGVYLAFCYLDDININVEQAH